MSAVTRIRSLGFIRGVLVRRNGRPPNMLVVRGFEDGEIIEEILGRRLVLSVRLYVSQADEARQARQTMGVREHD